MGRPINSPASVAAPRPGLAALLLGLALPDCRAHAPDENFPVENFEAGIRLNKALLGELAKG